MERPKSEVAEIAEQARIAQWLRLTGLPPPEHRGFVPAWDGVEKPDGLGERPIQPRGWNLPATPDDTDPGWHNVVRAYEEDR